MEEILNIEDIVSNVFPYLKSIKAENNTHKWSNKDVTIERKTDLKYDIEKPLTNKFSIVITDKISFSPEIGPFDIEIQIACATSLKTEKAKEEIEKYLSLEHNKEYFKTLCLPQSSVIISFLTDKMGYTPLILNPTKT